MQLKKEIENYISSTCEQKSEKALRELRLVLFNALRSIDQKLDSGKSADRTGGAANRCPHCNSGNTKGYGRNPLRSYCLDCQHAFVKKRSSLHYRRRTPQKILDLIVAIHTTDKSAPEIIEELKISIQTYYKWKNEIILVFPQLEEKFKQRGKNRGKL